MLRQLYLMAQHNTTNQVFGSYLNVPLQNNAKNINATGLLHPRLSKRTSSALSNSSNKPDENNNNNNNEAISDIISQYSNRSNNNGGGLTYFKAIRESRSAMRSRAESNNKGGSNNAQQLHGRRASHLIQNNNIEIRGVSAPPEDSRGTSQIIKYGNQN